MELTWCQGRVAAAPRSAAPGATSRTREGSAVQVLGIDIGGSGIKAAPVDTAKGTLITERIKVETPRPALPDAVAKAIHGLVSDFGWTGPTGIAFPGVVVDGITLTAANLDPAWVGLDTRGLFDSVTGLSTALVNDADAAGLAEMSFGAGAGHQGTVLMLTFGTGIGSALFRAGVLVPNTEFGHIEIRGRDAETRASERAKALHDLSWGKWAGRVEEYLQHVERLTAPDLFIIGGGISRKADKFLPLLTKLRATVVPAAMQNDAGIVGAALSAGLGGNVG
jgi:polyphosphate glucokinase